MPSGALFASLRLGLLSARSPARRIDGINVMEQHEQPILTTLQPRDLPSPPRSAIRIVQLCSREHSTSRDLAQAVACDPILTAEVLRICNSAFFGLRAEVRSATHAANLLGLRAIRNLALYIAMREAIAPQHIPGLPIEEFWESAIRRAVCAKVLAPYANADEDECFTVGLLEDFGLLVLFYLHPEHYAEWSRLSRELPDQRRDSEQALFGSTHDLVGLELGRAWGLPEGLRNVIGNHHAASHGLDKLEAGLCHVAACADWMASAFSATDPILALEHVENRLMTRFDIGHAESRELLSRVSDAVQQSARNLGFGIPQQIPLDVILRAAHERLAKDNLDYQRLTWELEKSLAERDRAHAALERELELAREVQERLLPAAEPCLGVHGINVSATHVSGDFYDHFRVKGDRICFCIADVSGKGVHAALLMAKASSLFRCLGRGGLGPAELAQMLNEEIFETSVRGMFVTMIIGRYDPSDRTLELVNAGHVPAFQLCADGTHVDFPARYPPLGVLPGIQYSALDHVLENGAFCAFTDGLHETRNRDGGRLEIAGVLHLMRRLAALPPRQRLERVLEDLRLSGCRPKDDVTMLLIEPPPAIAASRTHRPNVAAA